MLLTRRLLHTRTAVPAQDSNQGTPIALLHQQVIGIYQPAAAGIPVGKHATRSRSGAWHEQKLSHAEYR